jgi:hypothetical protein
MKPHFLVNKIEITHRVTEKEHLDATAIDTPFRKPIRHEEINVTLELIGSGNTKKITNLKLLEILLDRLDKKIK